MSRVVVVLAVMVGASQAAWASPVRLDTTGAACDLDDLDVRVARLVGHDPFDDDAPASVAITTRKQADQVIAQITFDDGNGRVRGPRIVAAATCAELVESTAMIVAMALPALEAPAAPVPTATPTPTLREHSVAGPISIERHEFDLIVAAAGVTSLEHTSEQLIAGVRWRRGDRSLTAEVRADVPEDLALGAMGHVHVFRTEASISPCLHMGGFAGCVLASVGTIHGSGAGLDGARSVFTPLVSGGLRTTWEHPLTDRLLVRLHIDLSALATQTRFDVDHMAVWTSHPVEGSAGVGVITTFP